MTIRPISHSSCLFFSGPERGREANELQRVVAFVALSLLALVGSAQAGSKIDGYTSCWSEAATSWLNENGVSEHNLSMAVDIADQRCSGARTSAGIGEGAASNEDIADMRQYMTVQLFNANPIPSEDPVEARREAKYPNLQPGPANYLTNAGDAFLCLNAGDVTNARQLVKTGRTEMVAKIDGCTPITSQIEVEPIEQFGEAIQVRWTLDDGRMMVAWTSSWLFKYGYAWR